MATDIEARDQLSRDMADRFSSCTTTNAAGDTKLDDDRLTDEDDDIFITEQATIWVKGGQVGGPVLDEERAIDSKVSNIITLKRSASVTIQSGVDYEVHRLFRAEKKDEALAVALDLLMPRLWKELIVDITTTTDQFDYDITAHGFHNNLLNEVFIVSDGDSEVDFALFAWEIRNQITLHFLQRLTTDRTVRLRGITKPALSDINQPQLQILTSRAAIYLYEGLAVEAVNDQVQRWERAITREEKRLAERISRHQLVAPPSTMKSEVYDHSIIDFNFFTT